MPVDMHNTIAFAPPPKTLRAKLVQIGVCVTYGLGERRSSPAEFDTTYNPRRGKPLTPNELPYEQSTTATPLEPAREPASGSIPG
jgi:hypothetical protein